MELLESKTLNNLAKAYAGECQATTRYKFIEYGARMQNYKALSEVIDTVIYQEFNHARMFYTFIQKASEDVIKNIDICSGYPFKEKWDLVQNLQLAAEDEKLEAQKIYPEYAKQAKEEGFTKIADLFLNIAEIEKKHMALFEELYEQLNGETLYRKKEKMKWVCGDCGYVHEGTEAFESCPVCQAKQGAVLLHLKSLQ